MIYQIKSVDVYPFNEHGEQLETGMKTYYHIYKKNKLIHSTDNKWPAEEYVLGCVESDNWDRSNRD